jgi:hypothetical protein
MDVFAVVVVKTCEAGERYIRFSAGVSSRAEGMPDGERCAFGAEMRASVN